MGYVDPPALPTALIATPETPAGTVNLSAATVLPQPTVVNVCVSAPAGAAPGPNDDHNAPPSRAASTNRAEHPRIKRSPSLNTMPREVTTPDHGCLGGESLTGRVVS